MLIDTLMPGGAERVAVEVACSLDPERFEPFFVVTRNSGPLEAPLRAARMPVHILGRRGRLPPVRTLRRARGLLRTADAIHAHMFGSSMWGALLARTLRLPLMTSDASWSGVRTWTRTWGYRYVIGPEARTIVCPSDRVARSIEEEGVPSAKMKVIENGVRLAAALPRSEARAELGLPQDDWVIGITANLRPEKAHEVLLRAFARVNGTSRPAWLCVVGDGPRRDELRGLASELGIGERVLWAGDRRDARRLASAFDTAVICSSWEGLPLAALEALASGVPLVATRVGALPDVVEGGGGVLVDVGDDAALARELATLMNDPATAREMGRRGIRRVDERYRHERMVAEFEQAYDELLAEPRRGRSSG